MDARMSISNMTTEWGALTGWFPVDEVALDYVRHRMEVLSKAGLRPVSPANLEAWELSPPAPDPDAAYAARIVLDLSSVSPCVAGPHTVQAMTPLGEMERREIRIHKAYLVSCVNSRLGDLAAAARVLQGRKVADGVEFYVAAASREVQENAEREGYWSRLLEAGAIPLSPGCGPCIGLGTGLLEPGEVGISATNRNFKGRMGSPDSECYLASPEVVAASAAAGVIRGPEPGEGLELKTSIEILDAPAPAGEKVEILDGFPERVTGRLIFLPQDNLNTDGIYGKEYTYREDVTKELMAKVVMENYDPEFSSITREGDVVVGGMNFGTGSSREQAVTALQAKGIAMVIGGSFSQTYLRNAFNNGFTCVECPELCKRLNELFAKSIEAGSRTILPGDDIEIDFASGTISYRESNYHFPPLGPVPQALVVAGGVENQIRNRLAD
jgi:homoaconitate hydratase